MSDAEECIRSLAQKLVEAQKRIQELELCVEERTVEVESMRSKIGCLTTTSLETTRNLRDELPTSPSYGCESCLLLQEQLSKLRAFVLQTDMTAREDIKVVTDVACQTEEMTNVPDTMGLKRKEVLLYLLGTVNKRYGSLPEYIRNNVETPTFADGLRCIVAGGSIDDVPNRAFRSRFLSLLKGA